jgi:hypothetical protein
VAAEKRAEQALQLKLAGVDWLTIADRLGYGTPDEAMDAAAAVAERQYEGLPLDRAIEVLRLDRLQTALWPTAMKGDQKAVETCLNISDRRNRLLRMNLRSRD